MRLTANTIEREPPEGGFSLIEVLVAAGLLVGSLAALAFVFMFATRANADAQYATYATVLAMQPEVVMVVVITSTGGVSKLFATFDEPVDSGLLAWAGEYLRERLVGLGLGARILQQRSSTGARRRRGTEQVFQKGKCC